MSKTVWLGSLALVMTAALAASTREARAAGGYWHHVAERRAANHAWHGHYYNPSMGGPVALVVPPTAEVHGDWRWGVSGMRVAPVWHQYHRHYPGAVGGHGGFLPTPPWPSDTDQFGVHYIRGPW